MNSFSLAITRPANQADSLIAELKKLNEDLNILHLPLIDISPEAFELPPEKPDKLIFISGNAVHHFVKSENDFLRRNSNQLQLFAVGEHTADKLKPYFNGVVSFPQQMNAEGLLALPQLESVCGQSIWLIKGVEGRPIIAESLQQKGAVVHSISVYRRRLPDFATQKQIREANYNNQLVWMITSEQALNHLFRILALSDNPSHATPAIVSSDRLKQAARNKGFTIIAQSAGASESQLVQCVKKLLSNQEK
ncbi:uroporphyrinogen-III synthase [Aliikangiella sp. G2MR2-5]|uniref:uroporphyrinogen-III synthase n=1 Tax=Aliikangiella sp. G2MR2-5 TaxID=2788943 RepID=UPI0018AC497B|nr:uroporphyrinogen-III synthase [Aliikangiella sp. G2MR2-5]